mmetsp:Transcript_7507/g.18974  ORF Transcript_7507/g.18974 Transcript_7507/m.18974 type:complete len:212 (-) Transcript_7507:915-1550(-)
MCINSLKSTSISPSSSTSPIKPLQTSLLTFSSICPLFMMSRSSRTPILPSQFWSKMRNAAQQNSSLVYNLGSKVEATNSVISISPVPSVSICLTICSKSSGMSVSGTPDLTKPSLNSAALMVPSPESSSHWKVSTRGFVYSSSSCAAIIWRVAFFSKFIGPKLRMLSKYLSFNGALNLGAFLSSHSSCKACLAEIRSAGFNRNMFLIIVFA